MSQRNEHAPQLLAPGTVLDGRFQILERLGAGSFGEVHRARQLVFGRPIREVALKLFSTEHVTPHNLFDVFADAVTLLGFQEEHPDPSVQRHLVQVFDIGLLKNPERAFMSMQLVRGGQTVLHAVERHAKIGMPVSLSLMFLRQLLVPLAWMHTLSMPVVHGDLKPDNILLTKEKLLVLTDFGLAARMPKGVRGGAIAYQAPETLANLAGGPESDIFAVGVTWYELLTGKHPFADIGITARAEGDELGFIAEHLEARQWPISGPCADPSSQGSNRIIPASELQPELTEHPQLEAMLHRCLAYSRSERYPNAKLLLADIDEYLSSGRVRLLAPVAPPSGTGLSGTECSPPSPAKLVADAEVLEQQGRIRDSCDKLQAAIQTDPDYLPAKLRLCRIAIALKDWILAEQTYLEAQKLKPGDPDVLLVLAELYAAQGNKRLAASVRSQVEARSRTK